MGLTHSVDHESKIDTSENSIIYTNADGKVHNLCYDVLGVIVSFLDIRYYKDIELSHPLFRQSMTIYGFKLWREYFHLHLRAKVEPSFFSPRFETVEDIEEEASVKPILWKKVVLFHENSLLTFVKKWKNSSSHHSSEYYQNRVVNWKGFYYSRTSDGDERSRNVYFPASRAAFSDMTLRNYEVGRNQRNTVPNSQLSEMLKHRMISFQCRVLSLGSLTKNHVGECLSAPQVFFSSMIDLALTPSLIMKQDNDNHELYHCGQNVLWEGTVIRKRNGNRFFLHAAAAADDEEGVTLNPFKICCDDPALNHVVSKKTKFLAQSVSSGDKVMLLGQLHKFKSGVSLMNLKISELGDSIFSHIGLLSLSILLGVLACGIFALPLLFMSGGEEEEEFQLYPSIPFFFLGGILMAATFPMHIFNGFSLGWLILIFLISIRVIGYQKKGKFKEFNDFLSLGPFLVAYGLCRKGSEQKVKDYFDDLKSDELFFVKRAIVLLVTVILTPINFFLWLFMTNVWFICFKFSCGIIFICILVSRLKGLFFFFKKKKYVDNGPNCFSRQRFLEEYSMVEKGVYRVSELSQNLDAFCGDGGLRERFFQERNIDEKEKKE